MGIKGPIRRQILSSVCGNLLTASYGTSFGWATANFLELQRPETLLPSGPLSLKQATLVVSMVFIGAIIGNLIFPYILERCGSQRLMFLIGFPQIMNWLLIIYAQNPVYLYVSSAVAGAVGSGQIISIAVFVAQISHDNIRGSLNSIFDPAYNLGVLLAFLLAKYFNYADQAKYHLILPSIYVILFSRIPESPQHLINMQREKAANKAQKFFKGAELEMLPVNEAKAIEVHSELTFEDFTNRRALKAFFIALSLMCLNSLQGFGILVTYVTEIFASSNPSISPIDASIIITTILIISNLIFMNVVDRAGRRTFFIYSSLATTVGLILFALYLHFLMNDRAFDWVPIVCLSYILFVSCLGMNTVPYIVSIEIFPKKIQQYGYSNCILLLLVLSFFLTELYPMLKVHIGLFGWIAFFAAMSLCNALFGVFILPETGGKSHETIMQLLDK